MSTAGELHDTVLVADDEVLVRAAIAGYLRECGYRVVEAANAEEARTVLADTDIRVDVVLSAVEMSGDMDGFGLARWTRENCPGVEVILAGTSKAAAKEAAELCDDGPSLKRPYEPQSVHDRIRRHLARRKKEPLS